MTGEKLLEKIEGDINDSYNEESSRANAFKEAAEIFREEGDIEKSVEAEIQYLIFSFSVTENAKERFKPMIIYQEGSSFPDEAALPKDVKQCLQRLVSQSKNPIHIARYGDFLWDKYKDYKSGLKALTAYIDYFSINVERKDFVRILDSLRRAIQLGIVFKKNEELTIIKTKALQALKTMLQSNDITYVGRLISELLRINSMIEKEEYDLMIDTLAICRVEFQKVNDFYMERKALNTLYEIYQILGDNTKSREITEEIGLSFDKEGDFKLGLEGSTGGPIAASHFYQKALAHFIQMGFPDKIDSLKIKIKETNEKSLQKMEPISSSFTLTQNEINDYLSPFLDLALSESLRTAAIHFIPKVADAIKHVQWTKQNTLFQFLVQQELLNSEGDVVCSPRTDEELEQFYLMRQLHLATTVSRLFFSTLLEKLQQESDLNQDNFYEFISNGAIFKNRDNRLIKSGINRFFNEDYEGAIHILLPQIESVLRNVLRLIGLPTTTIDSQNQSVIMSKTLGAILSTQEIKNGLGEDLKTYLNLVLIDQRGFNLRNETMHGILKYDAINKQTCEIILHVLLCLTLIDLNVVE
jgi:hypothetical protein